MKIEVKKYKEFKALVHEGYPFACQLWVDGKYVADVSYDASGGPYSYYAKDNDALCAVEEWAQAQPPRPSAWSDHLLPVSIDRLVDDAIFAFRVNQKVDRYRKKGIVCFIKQGGEEDFKKGAFYTAPAGMNVGRVLARYPGATIL